MSHANLVLRHHFESHPLRHPERVSALVLLVPLAYTPPTNADSAPPMSAWVETLMMRMLGSDFLFWAALHVARDQVIKFVLATPPELLTTTSAPERARVHAMLDHILPVSARAEGLKSDTAWANIWGLRRWRLFAHRRSSSVHATTAMAPMPARSTQRARLAARSSSALTKAGTLG